MVELLLLLPDLGRAGRALEYYCCYGYPFADNARERENFEEFLWKSIIKPREQKL